MDFLILLYFAPGGPDKASDTANQCLSLRTNPTHFECVSRVHFLHIEEVLGLVSLSAGDALHLVVSAREHDVGLALRVWTGARSVGVCSSEQVAQDGEHGAADTHGDTSTYSGDLIYSIILIIYL